MSKSRKYLRLLVLIEYLFQGDIHFNDEVPWTSGPEQNEIGFDFFRTMIHEAGHALGLEHSPNNNTIMYFAVKGYEKDLRLSDDDKEGIQVRP